MGWDLEDDSLLDTDLGFIKCDDMDTKNRPFIDTSTKANYIDLPYGYISLKAVTSRSFTAVMRLSI